MMFTWPVSLQMGTAIRDPGDPLLNTWILAWDVHQLFTSPGGFFEANIFYPHESSLAYSEHMFANSLIALPVIAITGKPILGYNTVFLLSFVIAGIGMYCLVLYLTGSRFAGIVSGMIFAFCPYRFDHLSHLQLLTNHWMPFTFLYLHRFFDKKEVGKPTPARRSRRGGPCGRLTSVIASGAKPKLRALAKQTQKDLLLFTLFFVLQCLSCGYYAVFLSICIGFMSLWFIFKRKLCRKQFIGMFIFLLLAGSSLYPFYKPYARVRKEMNFVRSLSETKHYSADVESYLAASPSNHLYGRFSTIFGDHEKKLFPGLMAIFLSIYGFLSWRGRARRGELACPKGKPKFYFIDALILISVSFGFAVLISGGFSFYIGKFYFSAHRMTNPAMITVLLLVIRYFLFRRREPFFLWRFVQERVVVTENQRFYLFLLILAFIFSLGPVFFLYRVFYKIFPPFQSIRVAARWGVMVTFSISVLAGFGARYLFEQSSPLRKRIICVLIPLILIAEYSCFPLKFHIFPEQVPAVYRWLSFQQGDFPIVELPMPSSAQEVYKETRYMYWSTFHWKKLVNGYSGFFPEDYWDINGMMQKFPSEKSIALLRRLGVRYVIVHAAEFRRGRWWSAKERLSSPPLFDSAPRGKKGDGKGASGLRHVISFGTDHVYEIN